MQAGGSRRTISPCTFLGGDGDGMMEEMEMQKEMCKLDLYSRLKLLEKRREVMWAVDPRRITSLH